MKTTIPVAAAISLQVLAAPIEDLDQLAQLDDLHEDLYNIVDESDEFHDTLDELN